MEFLVEILGQAFLELLFYRWRLAAVVVLVPVIGFLIWYCS